MRVAIVDIDATREAQLLRLMLESFGAEVRLTGLGRPSDFFSAFDFYGSPASVGLICGHGADAAFLMPEVGSGVDPLVLPDNRLNAEIIRSGLESVSQVVVSTACDTGNRPLGDAFLDVGADIYIAPVGEPGGASIPLLLGLIFYRVLHVGTDWPEAVAAANACFSAEDGFSIFTPLIDAGRPRS